MKTKSKGITLEKIACAYDLLTLTEKSKLRKKQIELIGLKEGEHVLDVGCGTGALTLLAKLAVGEKGYVAGIDIAPKMIKKANKKAKNANLNIEYKIESINQLSYPDESFDVVISSMMFHHLPIRIKRCGVREIHRVLKGNGRFFLTDFSSPRWFTAPFMFLLLIWLQSTRFQFFGKLPVLIRKTGFNKINLVKNGLFLKHYLIKKINF